MEAGEELAPFEFLVTPELNQQYLYAIEDFNPIYIDGDESTGPVVHPAILLNMSNRTRSPSFYLEPGWAAIHAADDAQFVNPASVGKRFRVTWKVELVYERRGRPWQTMNVLIVDEDGTEILRRKSHGTFAAQGLSKKQEG